MKFLLLIFFFFISLTFKVSAYIGPGIGLGALISVIGVILAIIFLLIALIWFPIKRYLRKKKIIKEANNKKND